MRIYIGSDHRGFKLKEKIVPWLKEQGHEVIDCGNYRYDPVDDSPDFARKVAEQIQQSPELFGLLLCGSGIDMSIMANRFKQVRCGLGINPAHVKHGRENDQINCLAIPAEFVDETMVKEMINVFLTTAPKNDEKYYRRVLKLDS